MPALGSIFEFRPLRTWWHKDDPPPLPITTRTASVLLVVYALVYFLPFYASASTRPSPTLTRDAPSVIRARIRSVTISCFICCITTAIILTHSAGVTPSTVLHLTGVWPPALADSARALLLTALLFAGPLFLHLLADSAWRDWTTPSSLDFPPREVFSSWASFRNIVAGPVTEEVLFRGASVPLMLVAQTPLAQTVLLSPVIFGLAHVHHFYEFRLTNPRVPAAAALLRSVFQFAYTTLFGAYATFLFVRTGSLLAVCVVHAFCNCMGLPKVWGKVREGTSASGLWTAGYYALLVAGSVAWYQNMWALTESENALTPVGAFS